MELKTCTACHRDLPITMFVKYVRRTQTHYSVCKECKAKYRSENKHMLYLKQQERRLENPESSDKRSAWNKVHYAVKVGKLVKPEKCEVCSSKDNIQAHHKDYTKPLEVIWVCQTCHSELDRKEATK